jgi:hypothetical protein
MHPFAQKTPAERNTMYITRSSHERTVQKKKYNTIGMRAITQHRWRQKCEGVRRETEREIDRNARRGEGVG